MPLQTSESAERDIRCNSADGTVHWGATAIQLTPTESRLLRTLQTRPGEVISQDDLKRAGWPEMTVVETATLHRHISNLGQKLTASTGREWIANRKGVGYSLVPAVEAAPEADLPPIVNETLTKEGRRIGFRARATAVLFASLALAICGYRLIQSHKASAATITDEERIRQVLKDSQVLETLTIYGHPERFAAGQLAPYFVMPEQGGRASAKIQSMVQRKLSHGTHYGPDARLDLFEVLSVTIDRTGAYAEAHTREKWYLPDYRSDGTRIAQTEPFFGPYELDYTLRKIGGRWLVQFASTPYSR